MGLLTKILKWKNHENLRTREAASATEVILPCYFVYHLSFQQHLIITFLQDAFSDFDAEEIDRAIALSIADEDQKGKQVLGICKTVLLYFLMKQLW